MRQTRPGASTGRGDAERARRSPKDGSLFSMKAGPQMDDVDLAAELMEIEAELNRRARASAEGPPRLFDTCRDCDERLEGPVLRAAGFCDRYCRDRFELAEKLKRINGQGAGR